MKVLKTSDLDNLTTLIFKWANFYKQPYTYILNRPLQIGEDPTGKPVSHDYVFESLEDVVRANPDHTLTNIYDDLFYWIDTSNVIDPLFYMFAKTYRGKLGMEEIKIQYDELMEHIGSNQQYTLDQMEDLYKHYGEKYVQEREETIVSLENIIAIQEYIESQEGLPFSSIQNKKRTLEAKIDTSDYEAIDLFNLAKLSDNVLYMRIHNSHSFKKDFYKIYENEDYKEYESRLIKFDTDQEGVSINFVIKVEDKKFTVGGFDFVANSFKIIMPIYNKIPDVLENINQCFCNKITTSTPAPTNMAGNFNVYGVDISENTYILLEEIMNNSIFSAYLYVEERATTSADRVSLIIHYSSTNYEMSRDKEDDFYVTGDLHASLGAKYGNKHESYEVWTPKGPVTKTFDDTTPYVEVVVTAARSEAMFYRFQYLISKLLYHFVNVSSSDTDSLLSFYEENVPELKYREKKIHTEQSALQRLKTRLPDAITTQYASRCQKKKQPEIIYDEDIADWKTKTFTDNAGHTVNREVVPFPPVDSKVYIGCPTDEYPYFHSMKNDGPNKAEYPYLPCCAASKDRPAIEEAYYSWKHVERTGKDLRPTNVIINEKILNYEHYGRLSNTFTKIIELGLDEEMSVVRVGTVPTKSSLIHCALMAVDNKEYLRQGTDSKRETYVKKFRRDLAAKLNTAIVQQEMYNDTDEYIRQQVASPDIVFDSRFMFRIIENLFDVSLFVFDLTGGTLETPNFKVFSVRPHEDRKCILVIKHTQKRVNLEYPIYEVIGISNDKLKNVTKLLPEKINKVVHDAYNYIHQNIVWLNTKNAIVPFNNIFSVVNYQTIFDNLTGQWIDSYGKTRAFVFEYDDEEIGVVVPPTMPLYLPIINELPVITIEKAVDLFGTPTHEDNVNGWIMGLWFKMLELEEAVYIPIEPIKNSFYPHGRPNPIMAFKSTSELQHLQELQKSLNIVLDLITWIFTFELEKNPYHRSYMDVTKKTVYYSYRDYTSNFIRLYTRIVNQPEHYELGKVVRKLPRAATIKEALKRVHQAAPTLAGDNYIICYTEEFRDKLTGYLADFLKANEGREIDRIRPKYITSMFQMVSDFKPQEGVYIFDDYRQLKTWTDQLAYHRHGYVVTELKGNLTIMSPIIYRNQTSDRIFMIQNTKTGFLEEALLLCRTWMTKHYNAGPSITGSKSSIQDDTYVKYRITNGQTEYMSQHIHPDKEVDETAYEVVEILTGKWAALLPLK
jgi:hypothetical protein